MKRLLLPALLHALSCWSVSSGTPAVTQTPDVSVMEGETVSITCCWTVEFELMTLNWQKNQTNIKSEKLRNHSRVSVRKEASDCSNLTFMSITKEHSGRYSCKLSVEIPGLFVFEGNETVITVTARDNTTDNTAGDGHPGPSNHTLPLPIIISLAVVAPLLLFTLAWFCTLRKRQALAAARVIYEVPHIDSEEADMDKHSTSSSRGSSQWCQVPVYESFDYFERVQTKDSE